MIILAKQSEKTNIGVEGQLWALLAADEKPPICAPCMWSLFKVKSCTCRLINLSRRRFPIILQEQAEWSVEADLKRSVYLIHSSSSLPSESSHARTSKWLKTTPGSTFSSLLLSEGFPLVHPMPAMDRRIPWNFKFKHTKTSTLLIHKLHPRLQNTCKITLWKPIPPGAKLVS